MAGIYSSPNLIYQPISLQEMLIPLQYVEGKHSEAEKQFAETQALANTIAGALDPNSVGYKQVNDYVDSVKLAADELAEKGLQRDTMKKLLDLKVNYAKQVAPVEYSKKRYDQDVEYLKQMQIKDPYYIGNIGLNELTPDHYLTNPNFKLDGVSGSQLTQILWKGLEPISKTFLEDPESFKKAGGNPYYLERLLQYGATPENVMGLLGSLDPGYVKPLIEGIIKGSDIERLGPNAIDRVMNQFVTALPAAIGQQTIDRVQDPESKSNKGLGNRYGSVTELAPITHRSRNVEIRRSNIEDKETAYNLAEYLGLKEFVNSDSDSLTTFSKNPSFYDFISKLDGDGILGHTWERLKGFVKSADNVKMFNNEGRFLTEEEFAKASNAEVDDIKEDYQRMLNKVKALGIEIIPGLTTQYDLAYEIKLLAQRTNRQSIPLYSLDSNNNKEVVKTILNNLRDNQYLEEVVGVGYDGELITAPYENNDYTGETLKKDSNFEPNISISTSDPTKLLLTYSGKQFAVPIESLTSDPSITMNISTMTEKYREKNELINRIVEHYINDNSLTKPAKLSKKIFNKMVLSRITSSDNDYNDYIKEINQAYAGMSESLVNSIIINYGNLIASRYSVNPNKLGLTDKQKTHEFDYSE